MTHRQLTATRGGVTALTLFAASVGQGHAYELYADDDSRLNADILAVYGWMDSQKNYDGTPGGSTWREGFVKYGFSGEQALGQWGTAYGALNWVSSATWGDGDAGGNSDGSERRTGVEDAYLGWRSGDLFPVLGRDGLDLSFGRQVVKLGRGFLINSNGPNLGRPPADGALNRGGAYYLAARQAFDRTAVLRLGGEEGLHGSAVWQIRQPGPGGYGAGRGHDRLHRRGGDLGADLDPWHRRARAMGQ